jgi:phytoene dehydrogenase-like protein
VTWDAVVVGAGPNGLVAANLLADAGWSVLVLEAQPEPGGGVRTAPLTRPGFHHDLFSAFYPLAAASPVIRALDLERHGLRWCHAPAVLAHPLPDGRCALVSRSGEVTAESLEAFAPGDGDAWAGLYRWWERVGEDLMAALFRPFPPVASPLRVAARLGPDVAAFVRFLLLPARRMAAESFAGEGGPLLLAGAALHTDLAPEQAVSGFFGWLLCCLGQDVGYPAPEGGPGSLTGALVRRLEGLGGEVRCGARVASVVVERGRAAGVAVEGGDLVRAGRAVLADVVAPALYGRLVDHRHLPAGFLAKLDRFQFDHGTVKVDWALGGPVPWAAPAARGAGTVHLGESLDHLTRYSDELHRGLVPSRPFLLFGQMTTTDPTRSPPGTEAAWAYTHVPHEVRGDAGGELAGGWDDRDASLVADRIEREVERYAPGFRDLVLDRHVLTPPRMEALDENLVGGSINGGTAALHQQGPFRPFPGRGGFGRPETPVRGLYLCSSSAHPGGGVHGACGANAARVALWHDRLRLRRR